MFYLCKGKAFLRGGVPSIARKMTIIHETTLLVLTFKEEKLNLMSKIVNLRDQSCSATLCYLPVI